MKAPEVTAAQPGQALRNQNVQFRGRLTMANC
jgi:hypothetical protein